MKTLSLLYHTGFITFLFACSNCCLSASAQNAAKGNILPAFALANGLRVLTRERHISPLVAIDLWVRAGSREETPSEDGCAHFLEHTLFKGTPSRPAGQADIDIENLGATLTAATGPDYAHFYTTVATVHVQAALDIMADVVCNATLPPVEIERERGVILDELAAHDSNPTAQLIDSLYAHAFPNQPYGHSPGGSPDAIRLRGRDTLAAFYAREYRPDRCVLVFAGDITGEQARQLAQKSFAAWHVSAAQPKAASTQAPSSLQQQRFEQTEGITSTQNLTPVIPALPTALTEANSAFPTESTGLAFPGPPAQEGIMAMAAQIAAEIMGDSRQYGRLYAAKISDAHIAARYTPRLETGLWLLTAQESEFRSHTPRLSFLRSLIADLAAHPPTPAELQSARGRILGRMQADVETNAGLAYEVGYAAMVRGDAPETLKMRLQAITTRDIQEFIRRYLLAQPGVAIYLSPTPHFSERRP